jgi:hypothetical protein
MIFVFLVVFVFFFRTFGQTAALGYAPPNQETGGHP